VICDATNPSSDRGTLSRMGALTDFWKSERGLLAILLVIGATVLTALGQMTIQSWQDYTLWIFGLYAGSKTVTGAVDLFTAAKRSEAAPAAAVAAAPATPATPPAEPLK
jgi:hypothetical protein